MAQREYVVIKRNLMRSFTVGKLALVHLFQEDTHTHRQKAVDQKLHHTLMCIHTYTLHSTL